MNHRAIYTIAAVAGITLTLLTGACRSETSEPSGQGTPTASPSPIERTEAPRVRSTVGSSVAAP